MNQDKEVGERFADYNADGKKITLEVVGKIENEDGSVSLLTKVVS